MRALKAVYRPVVVAALRALFALARAAPRRLALGAGELLGAAAFHLFRAERRKALAHLGIAFGRQRPRREIAELARESFRTVGRSFVETVRLPGTSETEILSLVDSDPFDPIEKALERGKGVLILSAHFGSWEVLAAYLAIRLGRPFHAIGRRIYFRPYDDLLVRLRRSVGVETVYQDDGARAPLRVLRQNRALGILADQDVPRLDGVFVEFFGRPAYTPTGPVALARSSGAGLVPVLIRWEGLRHRVHVGPEVELVKTGDRPADLVENTRRWSAAVERIIRARPENWVWFHRRWRTPPGPSAGGERNA